ncbi:MAG TPA: DUF5412 family protein [Armatimonadota bacterium]|nr:DUF5412 family protein [Armatimonadota bacterium]
MCKKKVSIRLLIQILLIGFLSIIGLYGAVLAFFAWLIPAHDTVLATTPSPDGRYVALLIERDCGATTDYATRVELCRQGICPWLDKRIVFSLNGRAPVTVQWRDARHVHISCPDGEFYNEKQRHDFAIYCARPRWHDVTITYRTKTGESRGTGK